MNRTLDQTIFCKPSARRQCSSKETSYLDSLVRGVYAKRDLPAGHVLTEEDFYLAIPLQKGQLSCRELIGGDVLVAPVGLDEPITIECFDNPYSRPGFLHQMILARGIDRSTAVATGSTARVVGGIGSDAGRAGRSG